MDDYGFTVFTVCILVNTVMTVLGQCPRTKFGPGCRYDCHCNPDVTCDPESGCHGECAEGWDGPTCQRQNVALKQTAAQTPNTSLLASNAVDGKRGHQIWATPCSVTAWGPPFTSPSKWTVTLDQEYNLHKFIIDLQDCCRDRMTNFILSVGQTSVPGFNYRQCYRDQTTSPSGPGKVINGQCSSTLRGDIVRIRTAKSTPLELCEVLLPVCSPGSWGEDCDKPCGHCWNNNTCSGVDGDCPLTQEIPRCAAGYYDRKCLQNCNAGEYRPDCNFTCGFCAEGVASCEIISGNCSLDQNQTRCKTGYVGVRCDSECPDGQWGKDCKKTCGHCWNDAVCKKSSGDCPEGLENPRCSAGYVGAQCLTRCSRGTWGENCKLTCSVTCKNGPTGCDVSTGECIGGCADGYDGLYCENTKSDINTVDNTGTIVGGVVGGIVALSLAVLGIVFILRNYRNQPEEHSTGRTVQAPSPSSSNKVQSPQGHTDITTEQPQYETVDNHDYSEIQRSHMDEEADYTSLS